MAGGRTERERQIEEKPKSLDLSLLLAEKGMRLLLLSLSLGGKRDILSPIKKPAILFSRERTSY